MKYKNFVAFFKKIKLFFKMASKLNVMYRYMLQADYESYIKLQEKVSETFAVRQSSVECSDDILVFDRKVRHSPLIKITEQLF